VVLGTTAQRLQFLGSKHVDLHPAVSAVDSSRSGAWCRGGNEPGTAIGDRLTLRRLQSSPWSVGRHPAVSGSSEKCSILWIGCGIWLRLFFSCRAL